MNVLVYAGPEVVSSSLDRCLTSLRAILTPHYSVQTLSKPSLTSDPWSTSCALLVLPDCKQPFGARSVQSFVEGGGAFLALSTSVKCMDKLDDDNFLRFFDQSSGLVIQPYHGSPQNVVLDNVTKDGSSLVQVLRDPSRVVQVPEAKNIRVFYRYNSGQVAAIEGRFGVGKAVLWTAALEAQIVPESSQNLGTANIVPSDIDEARKGLLSETLGFLGLKTPPVHTVIRCPLPQFLLASPSRVGAVEEILAAIGITASSTLKDENDTFQFHPVSDGLKLLGELRAQSTGPSDPKEWQPKHIIVGNDKFLPSLSDVPLFDMGKFFDAVSTMRKTPISGHWGIGDVAFYGEVVTSTQTMLDKNPQLLSSLPSPIVSIASYQLTGRGRGPNVWLSPAGCLQFSILLRLPLSSFPANKLVFIQYLFALAVVEACSSDSVLGSQLGKRVKLKWPNDIYVTEESGELKKIGGILVNTSFSGGKVDIVIGSGLNVLNPAPIMSLSQLGSHDLNMEKTAASILTIFETMWAKFVADRGSFDSFMDLYLERWLHSDQLVTITTVKPPQVVRIAGITSDHGLLRTVPEGGSWGQFIDLQPDGNSFDLMAGLIKAKVT